MQDNYFTLGRVARLLGKKSHLITYAITSGHVPEPELRLGNNRVFGEGDIERLARHFNIPIPEISSVSADRWNQEEPTSLPEGLSLAGPFTIEPAGTSGLEVRDGNGEVFCSTTDRPRALILAGLLEHACG